MEEIINRTVSTKEVSALGYRPDIDGIRAFAIIAVLAFHAFPELFPGGLIGVDIFFVISGYLITTILVSSLSNNERPILNFYIRRVRRIFPALLIVLICCYIFGYLALYADEFKELGLHIASGALFISNFVYLREAGYFDRSADLKPLLHFWSLAVEEQFYLFWPLTLILAFKAKITLTRLVIVLFIASFILSLWLSTEHPSWAYYFPFSRFWEILSGAYLAALNRENRSDNVSSAMSNYGNNIALAILLSSIFWIDGQNNFPGWQALPPVLATTWLIRYSNSGHWPYWCLANKWMVAVGLISYPLYLWHWPIFSFLAITELQISPVVKLCGIVLSFVLATLTYILIEKPIRSTAGKTAIVLLCGLLLVGYIGYNAYHRNGLDFRQVSYQNLKAKFLRSLGFKQKYIISNQAHSIFKTDAFLKANPEYRQQLEKIAWLLKTDAEVLTTHRSGQLPPHYQEKILRQKSPSIRQSRPKVVVIGDSHAGNFLTALQLTHPDIELIGFFDSGCTPIRQRYRDETNRCKQLLNRAFNFVKEKPVGLVIFAARWQTSFQPLADDIQAFSALGPRIAIAGPSLIFSKDLPSILLRYQSGDDVIAFTNNFIEKDTFALNEAMRQFAADKKIAYIDKLNIFCGEGLCRLTLTGNELFIYDNGHLSPSGAYYLGEHIKESKIVYKLADSSLKCNFCK